MCMKVGVVKNDSQTQVHIFEKGTQPKCKVTLATREMLWPLCTVDTMGVGHVLA